MTTFNVFDSAETTPHFLAHWANALHVTTHSGVVRRLVLFDPGDSYDSARVVEAARYLRSLGVFRAVDLDTTRLGDRLALDVVTRDGWSTSPTVTFASTAGSVTWSVGILERNFLGTAALTALSYTKTPDRSALVLEYRSPGLLLRRTPLQFSYADLSDGTVGAWAYGMPFYETTAPWSLETYGEFGRQRVLDFVGGVLADSSQRRATVVGLRGGAAVSRGREGYVRLLGDAQWRREDFDSANASPFPYSTFGSLLLGAEASAVRYRSYFHLNGFARQEDVDLSRTLRVELALAPKAWGYAPEHAGAGPQVKAQLGVGWNNGLLVLRAEGHGIYAPAGLDSGLVLVGLDFASQALPHQALIIHAEGGALRNPKPGSAFDPWATRSGPRGFGAHAFTGTRQFWIMAEDRMVVTETFLGILGVGVAPFVDYGGAWYAGVEPQRTGGDAGMALRFGGTRGTRGDVAELDVAYRWGDSAAVGGTRWVVSFRESYTIQ